MTDNHQTTTPSEWKDDPTKSAEENAAGKIAFEKAATDKAAADKIEADKKAAEAKTEEERKALAEKNDTKKTPFEAKEIKLPEGVMVDEGAQKAFTDLVNKFGIPRDAAAALVDLQVNTLKALSEKDSGSWDETQEKWLADSKKDATYGGAKFDASMASIGGLIAQYGDDNLRAALDLTGAGNHPAFFNFFAKIAAQMGEGGVLKMPPSPGGTGDKSAADILYPNQGKN